MSACALDDSEPVGNCEDEKCDFFENSRRREATDAETAGIGAIETCTGFFLANQSGKAFFMTAQHCVNYDMQAWCDDGGFLFNSDGSGPRRCVRVVAGDDHHDPVIIEVSGSQPEGASRLAGFGAADGTRLKMLGYPTDGFAPVGLTVTENCWIVNEVASNPFVGTEAFDKGMQDDVYGHNCSVFGGNSGGPMKIEGSDIVVGQPYSFRRIFVPLPFTDQSYGAVASDLVADFQSELEREGIEIATSPENSDGGEYLAFGSYQSSTVDCPMDIVPIYKTTTKLKSVKLRSGCGVIGEPEFAVVYACNSEGSHCERETGEAIRSAARGSFVYRDANGDEHRFDLLN